MPSTLVIRQVPPGTVLIDNAPFSTSALSVEELSAFIHRICQNCFTSSGERYLSSYMEQAIMAYMISGAQKDFNRISGDRGLCHAARELRVRLERGECSKFGYIR